VNVIPGETTHIAPWLELVREVEPLFGPMPDFEATLGRNIARGSALAAVDGATFAGGLLLGGAAPDFKINWLAVRASCRRLGAGDALLRAALERFSPPCVVTLETFRAEEPPGLPARRLYEKHGFRAGALLAHQGAPRQTFSLKRA